MLEADIDWQTEIKTADDLLPPGATVGTVPTDLEQATGLERLEILGKMQGVDIFDMKPLDASRKGTCPQRRNQTIRNWAHLDERDSEGNSTTDRNIQARLIILLSSSLSVTSNMLAAPATPPTRTSLSGSRYVLP